jgi:hypothetical protein
MRRDLVVKASLTCGCKHKASRVTDPAGVVWDLSSVGITMEDREQTHECHRGQGGQGHLEGNREPEHHDGQTASPVSPWATYQR